MALRNIRNKGISSYIYIYNFYFLVLVRFPAVFKDLHTPHSSGSNQIVRSTTTPVVILLEFEGIPELTATLLPRKNDPVQNRTQWKQVNQIYNQTIWLDRNGLMFDVEMVQSQIPYNTKDVVIEIVYQTNQCGHSHQIILFTSFSQWGLPRTLPLESLIYSRSISFSYINISMALFVETVIG